MHEKTSRPRAATTHEGSRLPWRFIACWAVALAMVATIATTFDAAPAESDTSPRYQRLWNDLGPRHKQWARSTSECESGRDRNIHGGGGAYHGAFQFMKTTWRNSPKSPGGDPHRYSWRTQAVVAVYLKKRDGARTHWPHCG